MLDRPTTAGNLSSLSSLATASRDTLSLREIEHFLRRYGRLIGITTLAVTALVMLYSVLATPIYTGHAQILIESRLPQVLRQQLGEATLALDSPQIESQIAVLRSEQLARAVINKLSLMSDDEFAPPARRGLWALITGRGSHIDATEDAQRLVAATQAFQTNLDVRRYGLSYVLDVNFSSRIAEKAARIANAVAEAYLSDQLQVKVSAARQASDWREEQVAKTRDMMNKSARAVQEFRAKRDYRLPPVPRDSSDAKEASAPSDARPAPVGSSEKRDGNTLEELEVTALAYKKLYEASLQSHVEAVQRQALQFTDARVITTAGVPLIASFPKTKLLALLGLTMGLLLGLGAAVLLNAMEPSASPSTRAD